jgi:cytochrome P450
MIGVDVTTEAQSDFDHLVRVDDPDFYLRDPWPVFAWMQAERPFFYVPELDTYVVTRYADIKRLTSDASLFVNSRGLFLNDVKYQQQAGDELITDSFFPKGGEQVGTSDPPRQPELRRVLAPAFSLSALDRMRGHLAAQSAELVGAIPAGEQVDWIPIASTLPVRAGSRLIGLPDADHAQVSHWSDELEKLGGDITFEELRAAAHEFASLQDFIIATIEARRANPEGEDLITTLLKAELHEKPVTEANIVMFAMTMLAAGTDTTRSLLAGLVHTLAQHPAQWAALRADRRLVAGALEETLRWVTPARAFLRTATADTVVGEQPIGSGQHVYLMYMAANRDPEAFPDPHTYDIRRPNAASHVAFGSGAHVCAGSRLVRLEAGIMLNTLLDRFAGVEIGAPATPVRHIIRNGWSAMPVVFRE